MGYGYWTRESFVNYSASRGRAVTAAGHLDSALTDQQLFTQRKLHSRLNPKNVIRECCDSAEHPASIPVILALDVTGSMGSAAAEVAKKMNEVMTRLYEEITDVEFLIMGIGDLTYDRAPIQISQFESDCRIAEQLDLVYMEHGGGGNDYESYTVAWYMGARHTRLDCWNRGKKGLIITMGDEPLNPVLPCRPLSAATGDALQADVETRDLYGEVSQKYDLYHIHVRHRRPDRYADQVQSSFGGLLPKGHLVMTDLEGISETLVRIVTDHAKKKSHAASSGIFWKTDDRKAEKPEKKGLFRLISW